jgi:hypothetical protein
MLAKIDSFQEEINSMLVAFLEKTEANPEEMKSVAENQEVPYEDAAVDTIGTPKTDLGTAI